MLLRLKLRLGVWALLLGAAMAAVGELLMPWSTLPLTRNWFISLGLIVLGVLALLYGITTYSQLSEDVTLLNLGGIGLLALGGIALLLGTIVLNVVVVPLLLGIAATVGTVVNAPGSAVESATNSVVSGLNSIGNAFGGGSSVPNVEIPRVDGIQLISNALISLHLPSLAVLKQWGDFFSSGGPLTLGCLAFGLSLLKRASFPRPATYALIGAAGINALCQLLAFGTILPASMHASLLAISGALLFASLAAFAATTLFPQRVSHLWSVGKKQIALLRR